MGWKNVKEHYGITHYVAVYPEKGICIGSGYVHDLIAILDTDRKADWRDGIDRNRADIGHNLTISRPNYMARGKPFDGWVAQWIENPAQLRQLIDKPDSFANSITVYTYDYDGNIIEKLCEEPGWPNVTHDGRMMYENTFSTDRDQVVAWAKRELTAARDQIASTIRVIENEQDERRKRLAGYEAGLAKL